jgi:hypothetical protein
MNVGNAISSRMQELLKLKTLPEVTQKTPLLRAMIDGNAIFDDFSLENCETIRLELRDLMRYIPDKHVINTSDFVIDDSVGPGLAKKVTYEDRVRDYLLTSNNPALAKLRNLDELTQEEKDELADQFTSKLGTPADYAKWAGNAALLPFLRIQVGIADEAVQTKFGSFLNGDNLDNDILLSNLYLFNRFHRGIEMGREYCVMRFGRSGRKVDVCLERKIRKNGYAGFVSAKNFQETVIIVVNDVFLAEQGIRIGYITAQKDGTHPVIILTSTVFVELKRGILSARFFLMHELGPYYYGHLEQPPTLED